MRLISVGRCFRAASHNPFTDGRKTPRECTKGWLKEDGGRGGEGKGINVYVKKGKCRWRGGKSRERNKKERTATGGVMKVKINVKKTSTK